MQYNLYLLKIIMQEMNICCNTFENRFMKENFFEA